MPASLPLTRPPRSLCILRLSALGDVTHVLPLIATLQKHWPDTALTWIVGAFEHKLVGDLPGVELIPYRKKGGLSARKALAETLSGRRFDVLLNLQVAFRANLLSTLIKADIRLGYDRARSKDLHGLFITHRIPRQSGQHVVDCFFSFLARLGLAERELHWDLPLSEADHTFARTHLPDDRPNLIISPCSSHALRNWSAEGYAAVADYAARTYGMRVVLTGGPSELERHMGSAIETAMQTPAVNLVGKDTIKQLAAMLQRADLVISPDSGPAHMASAAGTPVIGLYAASNVKRSGPYRSVALSVDRYDDASQRYKRRPADALKWGTKLEYPGVMDLITVPDVTTRIDAWAETKGLQPTNGGQQLPPEPTP